MWTGSSKEELLKSPFLEKLLQQDLEVVFMTDSIDEYVMSHLTEFDDKKFQNASKDNLKLGKDDKKAAKALKARLHSSSVFVSQVCAGNAASVNPAHGPTLRAACVLQLPVCHRSLVLHPQLQARRR